MTNVAQLTKLNQTENQAFAMFALAETYLLVAQYDNAIPLFQQAADLYEFLKDYDGLCHSNAYLAQCLIAKGKLREAETLLCKVIILSGEQHQSFYEGISLWYLADLLSCCDRMDEATVATQRASHLLGTGISSNAFGAEIELALAQKDFSTAKELCKQNLLLCEKQHLEYGQVMTLYYRGLSEIGLERLQEAESILNTALVRALEGNFTETEIGIHLALAKLQCQLKNDGAARAELQEIWEPVEHGPDVIRKAEALNILARIELRSGNHDAAIKAAKEAYCLAWCDGPPYAYIEGLEEASQILGEGTIPTNLPPFDAARYEPLPELILELPTKSVFGLPTGITDTKGWTEEQVRAKLEEVKKKLDWDNTKDSAHKWWDAFETENKHRVSLILRLAEELAYRKATITEFFLAYVYSNADNIQANLHYLDYTRLKKEEEKRKKGELPFTAPATQFLSQPLGAGITDTRGWTEDKVRNKLDEVKKKIDWDDSTEDTQKWWESFETENEHSIAVILRLTEELLNRKATISEFHLAYGYSDTDNIQANLHYLDYTRLKKEEGRKRKEAEARAAAAAEEETRKKERSRSREQARCGENQESQ